MMKIGYEVKFVNSTNDYFVYNTKIIETPTTKEIYFYESPIYSHSNTKSDLTKTSKRKTFDEMSAHKQYDSLKRKQKHYEQTRWEIARIVDCNFDNKTKFLTLTFKDNIQDIAITNREFKYFIQRLNYYLYQTKIQTLKYIATWEKQKRGAIHYHVIFFYFPYIAKEKLQELWSHGFIKINRIDVDSKENRGRYLSKYFGKDLELKEHKKKAFFKSQNLKMPMEQKLMLTDDVFKGLEQQNIVFQKKYIRQVYDTKSFITTGSLLKDSSVTYIKIKKSQNRCARGISDE